MPIATQFCVATIFTKRKNLKIYRHQFQRSETVTLILKLCRLIYAEKIVNLIDIFHERILQYYTTLQNFYRKLFEKNKILKLSQYIAILLQTVVYSHNDIFLHFLIPGGSDLTTLFSSEFPLHYENIMKWCNTRDNRMQNIAHCNTKIQNHKETQHAMS